VMTASILIGVHGAALTNMVWQPSIDSTVIEIGFKPRKVRANKKGRPNGRLCS
jgi:capsular polysaccharide biosynthesis protein